MLCCAGLALLQFTRDWKPFAKGQLQDYGRSAAAPRKPFLWGLSSAVRDRARFRGYNTDLSKVAQFKRAPIDTGSTEVQVAQLTARVQQLTTHLQEHRKDYACRRGLVILLGQRRRLMKYLYNVNRCASRQGRK